MRWHAFDLLASIHQSQSEGKQLVSNVSEGNKSRRKAQVVEGRSWGQAITISTDEAISQLGMFYCDNDVFGLLKWH